jgi:four helix bundle protein
MSKTYDLEDRTKQFAKDCRALVRILPKDIGNTEDGKQLVRASGSVAANYIEANESLSKKDFVFRVKICRKESKENKLWLELLHITSPEQEKERHRLIQEATELLKIFSAIIAKSQ